MDIIGLAGNLWQVNQNLLNSTLSLGGALFNKTMDLMGFAPKEPPKVAHQSRGWISLRGIVIISTASAGIYLVYRLLKSRKRRTPYIQHYEPDMVYLFQFPRPFAIPNLSPFALKLETWLRMSDINYRVVEDLSIFHRSPEGTLPYIELNGEEIVDSANIIDVLSTQRDTTDSHLKPEQHAIVRAFEIMVECSFNLCTAMYRYNNFDKFAEIWPFSSVSSIPFIPTLLKWHIGMTAKKRIASTSIGKHSNEMVEGFANMDLQALSDQLGSKHYLTGFKPTRADAAAFAGLCFVVYVPFDSPQRRYLNENCPNLYEYCERIRIRYWPDWNIITTLRKENTEWKRMIKPSGSRPTSRPASTAP